VVVAGLCFAILVLLVLILAQDRQLRRLRRRLDGLTRGASGTGIGGVLDAHVDRVQSLARELDELRVRSALQEVATRRAIQRVGFVRFNPFEDTGGNQSFALALIDGASNGLIVSSLHSRTGTRIYAKAISDGRSDGALSKEEAEALRQALSAPGPVPSGSGSWPRGRTSGAV
jgi:hypothetical protein